MMLRYFVSGTNTDVGKTVFSGLLARELREKGMRVRYVKPVQTGHPPDNDAETVLRISGLEPDRVHLLFTGTEPVAPCFLWDEFPFEEAVDAINAIRDCDALIVEGAGGLLVPLDSERFMYEFVGACNLQTCLVVPNRLGCISDALLSTHFLQAKGLPLGMLAVNNRYASDSVNRDRNVDSLIRLVPKASVRTFDVVPGL